MFEKEREFEILEDSEQYDPEYEEPEEALEDDPRDVDAEDSAEYELDPYLLEEEEEY